MRTGRVGRTCERSEPLAPAYSLYAPPVCVGLLATNAMIAVMFEKPRRVARGTSGCILRGDRGPLVAGWGARLAMLDKGCATPTSLPSGAASPEVWAGRARRAARCSLRKKRDFCPSGEASPEVWAPAPASAGKKSSEGPARLARALLWIGCPRSFPETGARCDRGGSVALGGCEARGPAPAMKRGSSGQTTGEASPVVGMWGPPTRHANRNASGRAWARSDPERRSRGDATMIGRCSELVGATGVGGFVGDEGHDGRDVREAAQV